MQAEQRGKFTKIPHKDLWDNIWGKILTRYIKKKQPRKEAWRIYFSNKVFENIFWIISIEIRLSPQFWNLVVFDNIIRTRSVFPQCCKSVGFFDVLVNYQPEHTNIGPVLFPPTDFVFICLIDGGCCCISVFLCFSQ